MSDANGRENALVWYHRAKRIPRLIGKPPGGGHYPGGPYTITQAVGGGLTLVLLMLTEGLWGGSMGFFGAKIVEALGLVVAVAALRFVRPGGRNPLSALGSLAQVAWAPRTGVQAGRAVRLRPTTHVRARVNVHLPGPAPAGRTIVETSAARADTTPQPARQHVDAAAPGSRGTSRAPDGAPATGLQQLLAAAAAGTNSEESS